MLLAQELLDGADSSSGIAVVSAPSVFVQLKNILVRSSSPLPPSYIPLINERKAESTKPEDQKPKIWLLEYDKRFEVFPEFVFYDFKDPLKLPRGYSR
jgi:hypothetical protein